MKIFIFRRMRCPKCKGSGTIKGKDIGEIRCEDCKGTGRVLSPRENG